MIKNQLNIQIHLHTDQTEGRHPYQEKEPLEAWPDNVNPNTGETGTINCSVTEL